MTTNPISNGLKAHARVIVRGALAAGWVCGLLAHYGSSHTTRMVWLVATALCALVIVFASLPLFWEDDMAGRRPRFWPTFGYLFPFAMLAALPKFGASWAAPALSAVAALAITLRMQTPPRRPASPSTGEAQWQDAVALLIMPAVALVVLTGGVRALLADRHSAPFLKAAAFEALPGCPMQVAAGDTFPKRCRDKRYLIPYGADRYGLPQPPKGRTWRRIGRDAVLTYCSGESCYVIRTRQVFPRPQ